ncbi:PadR family transcriptional regulator [Mycoplasmatota bacterium]|nr:PadR family transcriptional regulator [Mycoplasmatota bacterium]
MSQKYAILGLLNISPMTGYMIKKNLELSMQKFWPISYGGLYPALHKLAKEKLVQVEDQDGSRGQLLYYITDNGKKTLHEWLMKKSSIQIKDEYILKIFLSKDLTSKERIKILKDYLLEKQQLLNGFKQILDNNDNETLYIDQGINIVTKFTLLTLESEVSILQKIIKEEEVNV